ncbi:hypothetical protein RMATCC62417_13431 [Rhizopus microsporus]|nr:hypothetical protein RMATCC62417_13431 [Rhizopus microsporus]
MCFPAADFLGYFQTIGRAALLKMAVLCHQFKCVCSECAVLLPFMLLFADKHAQWVPELRNKLVTLYVDLLDPLAPLWSQKPFAILINPLQQQQVLVKEKEQGNMKQTATKEDDALAISDIFSNNTVVANTTSSSSYSTSELDHYHSYSSLLLNDLIERITADMTRHNSTVIGFGFSVDFLAFVLSHVVTEGIHDGSAAVLYQGIVRDLGDRQEMVTNVAIDGDLLDARTKCAQSLVK